jgi:hypothetical protein
MFGLPSDTLGRGPVVGLHGGGRFDLGAAFFVNAEVGFQAGFQTASVDGSSQEYYASFMQIGLGAGVRI